ncbi:MAG: hypothetical protein Q4G18_09110 [Myroides sp.]|nr:hypothetical protein [uncultured Flavobacterium sp.]MBS7321089.1 hypothetical protein [Myroides sp.]MDO5637397.1 hypothetical protein [Myroides sp.]
MNLTVLHQLTQEIIDAIGNKQPLLAKKRVDEAEQLLNQLTDFCNNNDELVELSKYQTLISLLQNKLK